MPRPFIRFTATALALTLCAGVGTPTNAGAAEPRVPAPALMKQAPRDEPAPAYVGLRVDTKALGADAEPIATKVDEQAKLVFDRDGVLEPLDDKDPVIVVVVERAQKRDDPGYVIGFSIEQGEDVVSGSARQSDCSLCTRTELIERIGAELPKLIELAREYQVVREVDTGDEGGDEGGGEGGDEGDEGGEAPVKPIGPLGFGGIGLGVVGLGGVGAGVALVVKGIVPIPNSIQDKNYRTPGTIILAVGGAALIAGVVMIALDVSKRSKQRKAGAKRARVEWIGAGLAF